MSLHNGYYPTLLRFGNTKWPGARLQPRAMVLPFSRDSPGHLERHGHDVTLALASYGHLVVTSHKSCRSHKIECRREKIIPYVARKPREHT